MKIDWSVFVSFVAKYESFLLMTHVRPDGDALGSEFALADALTRMGKKVQVVISSVLPPRYQFLDPDNTRIYRFRASDVNDPRWQAYQAVIIVDTGTWSQLGEFGDFLKKYPTPRLVIDHHITQDDLGGILCQDTSAESCARLVHEAILALGQPHTEASAQAVFLGLAMDTGWFHHGNTTAESFALAAELSHQGASAKALYASLYEANTLPRMKLMARALERMEVREGGQIAFTHVRRGDYGDVGAVPGDTEDFIEFPRSLAGVEVAVLFMEQPAGGIKVSLRSRGKINVAAVAETFGGGGHRVACGCTLPDPLEGTMQRVLAEVQSALHNAKDTPADPLAQC